MDPLGSFLRARRQQLRPDHLGAADVRRRRTPGLRREEVARLAGISAEWYTRLEQGRAAAPSVPTIDALARALRLDDVEHAHLRALAHRPARLLSRREIVPTGLQRLVQSLADPAYVTGRRWDVLAWNVAAAELFVDLERLAPERRNILLYVLTDQRARSLFGEGWAEEARRMVALFRAAHDISHDNDAFARLVGQLRDGCPEFQAWWDAHRIAGPTGDRKSVYHPTRGALCFEYLTLHADEHPELLLTVLMPVV